MPLLSFVFGAAQGCPGRTISCARHARFERRFSRMTMRKPYDMHGYHTAFFPLTIRREDENSLLHDVSIIDALQFIFLARFAILDRPNRSIALFKALPRHPFLFSDKVVIARKGSERHELRCPSRTRFAVRAMAGRRCWGAFGAFTSMLIAKGCGDGFKCQISPRGRDVLIRGRIRHDALQLDCFSPVLSLPLDSSRRASARFCRSGA